MSSNWFYHGLSGVRYQLLKVIWLVTVKTFLKLLNYFLFIVTVITNYYESYLPVLINFVRSLLMKGIIGTYIFRCWARFQSFFLLLACFWASDDCRMVGVKLMTLWEVKSSLLPGALWKRQISKQLVHPPHAETTHESIVECVKSTAAHYHQLWATKLFCIR